MGGRGGINSEEGFSLVELIITMAVFVLVIAAASQVFTGLLTQFKQQSKIAETNIEGIVGLEILRQDIEHAGYGLPWNVTGITDADADGNLWEHLPNYNEAAAAEPAVFNDATRNLDGDGYDGEEPRAIVSGNNMNFSSPNNPFDGSDYLVIKATNVARNATAQKWTFLYSDDTKKTWTPDCENVNKESDCTTKNTVKIVVISPGSTDTNSRSLVVSGGAFFTRYDNTGGFRPPAGETHFIYGVDPDTDLRMPFNRADYYIWRNSTSTATDEVPDRCAPNTGVLRKAVISHVDGDRSGVLPLLDCVVDMQVVFGLDTTTTPDGAVDCYVNNLANSITVNAENIRNRVREVRVYILAHEGQYDRDFTYATNLVRVGEDLPRCAPGAADETVLGRNRDLSNPLITNWQNYRWKVYTLVVKPNNLR